VISRRIKIILLLFFFSVIILFIFRSGGENSGLKWDKFDSGLEKAQQQKKFVLIDVYTDWCKWCKKMDEDVYSNQEVRKYLDDNFVCIKLNGEGSATLNYRGATITETELTQRLQIDGFPTSVFLKPNGEQLSLIPGYYPPDKFLEVLKNIIKNW
jgi:thioredoxin-related protein